MRFGPTSLRLSGVLAKGLRRPKFRTDVKVSEQVVGGEKHYVIKVPEMEGYARFGDFEYDLLKLCDGTRTPAELAAAMGESHPESPLSEEEVTDWVDGVDPSFWQRSLGEKNLAILERIREDRKQRVDRSSLLYIYFSAWNPDRTLEKLHRYLWWLYTPGFVIASVLLFAATTLIVISDFVRIRQDTGEFYNFANKTAYDLWIFWVLLFVVSGFHEFGHGLTCKHYGGEVRHMGLMLMYFTPSFYTDCTDMYMFDRTGKRLWTIFAGLWIELVLCGVATFVWFLSPPGSFIGDLGYKTLLMTGVSGVFFNLNPLMKFDGYFALSQFLEIENLRDDSFDYLKAWLRRMVLRQDVDLPPVGRRKRRIFLTFGISAFLYSALLIYVVTIFIKNIFVSKFGDWGYLFTAGVVYLMLRKRVRNWIPGLVTGLRTSKEKFMAWKLTRLQWAGALAVVGLITLPPTRTTITTEFLLEPGQRAEVRASTAGVLTDVRVREGDTVSAGTVLAVLRNAAVESQATVVERERELAARALMAAQARGDLGAIQRNTQNRQRLDVAWAEARRRREGLLLRAPLPGTIATPQVDQRIGEYLAEGDTLAVLADRQTMRARVLVRDWELEDVFEGARVKLKTRAFPLRTFDGQVEKIMPAAALDRPVAEPHKLERKGQELTNYFAVELGFPNPEGDLREGMTGTAKIYGRRSPLIWRAGRSGWRWLRSLLW